LKFGKENQASTESIERLCHRIVAFRVQPKNIVGNPAKHAHQKTRDFDKHSEFEFFFVAIAYFSAVSHLNHVQPEH
jgi:hypothetical protein